MNKNEKIFLISVSIFIYILINVLLYFCLPNPLFNDPYSIVVTDKNDELLGAKIANDGQWRFPEVKNVSEKFKICITNFEDKRFEYHHGIDPIAVLRALKLNMQQHKIVSGGSTITMQLVRLSRKTKERSYLEKIIEMYLAHKIETRYSKNEILCIYASHAPFGGNIVGIEAAAWRYFGRNPNNLSWAENAMLAVLPNAPAMINTKKNREILKKKRDKLLNKLYVNKYITNAELQLALDEDIPQHPNPYPIYAYHLVERINKEKTNAISKIKTTIDIDMQMKINDIINKYHSKYQKNFINNIACLIIHIETGNVLVYIGNGDYNKQFPEKANDMIMAKRSTGSLLKPILYAAALTSGEILPQSLLFDYPVRFGNFSPENYDHNFYGAVKANQALAKSLNVPFVLLLKDFGIYKFQFILKTMGLKSINKTSEHYGLSLILGGAEVTLWEIVSVYASMARTLIHYNVYQSKYNNEDYHQANYFYKEIVDDKKNEKMKNNSIISASSIWCMLQAMSYLNRPGDELQWQNFSSKQKIAWKTGTSFGFKDAWSIGVTTNYAIGVWVGNASGEGRAGIVGGKIAAPILFEITNILPKTNKWFEMVYDDMIYVDVCEKSGHIANNYCEVKQKKWVPKDAVNSEICPYCKLVKLDTTENYRVSSKCYDIDKMKSKIWFVLKPKIEKYYAKHHAEYKTLPPYMDDCNETENSNEIMEIIYPNEFSKINVAIEISGDTMPTIFKLAHQNKNAEVYWYINNKYYGTTKELHEMSFKLKKGKYTLHVVDNNANKISRKFEIINKNDN